MKKLFLLLVLISSSVIFAQAPKGMAKIDVEENRFAASFSEADQSFNELYNGEFRKKVKKASAEAVIETNAYMDSVKNKYSAAAYEAGRLTNEQYAARIAAFYKDLEQDLGKIRQIYLPVMSNRGSLDHIQTNDPLLKKLLNNFYDGARHYKVDYAKKLVNLQKVLYVDADPYFLGEVSKDGSIIYLNSALLNYEHLNWTIFNRQMGKLYGLKGEKTGHGIMSLKWEIGQEDEDTAMKRRSRPHEREEFFKALAKENPLTKKI